MSSLGVDSGLKRLRDFATLRAGSLWSLLQTPTSIAAIVNAARDGSAIDPEGLET